MISSTSHLVGHLIREIERAAQDQGNPPDFALPNDHSRRLDGEDWTIDVVLCGRARLAPNLRPYCSTCCYDGPHHIFWSRTIPEKPRANCYKVVDLLYWCDGSIATVQI
jgi:hypothetical protein